MNCSYCQQSIVRNLSVAEIICLRFPISTFCPTCRARFLPITQPCCSRCKKSQQVTGVCQECQDWEKLHLNVPIHHALYRYEDGMKEWLWRFKFNQEHMLATAFATPLYHALRPFKHWIICPIPLSKAREKQRGYNQVSLVLERNNISYQMLLNKMIDTSPQSEKNRMERLHTPQPFSLQVNPQTLRGQSILLLDDVYTTGRTLLHAVECFSSLPIKEIQTFSFAR